MFHEYKKCILCPRKCGVNRYESKGVCGMNAELTVAKATLHKWEEPCISYKNGAGAVFFSGCSLKCVYCQNALISTENFGINITAEKLSDIFLNLQDRGADNIELVTATHFLPHVLYSLDKVKHRLHIPIIYNSGGYELEDTIKQLDGYIDIYLPDIKYFSPEISQKYSHASDYFFYVSKAVKEMIRQTGKLQFNDNGGLIKGTIIRHLELPSCRQDSMKIMDWIAENTSPEQRLVSIMSQYTPMKNISSEFPELHRRIKKIEYNSLIRYAVKLGIDGYTQEISSANEEYIPDFNLEGLN